MRSPIERIKDVVKKALPTQGIESFRRRIFERVRNPIQEQPEPAYATQAQIIPPSTIELFATNETVRMQVVLERLHIK